jgi:hypothetical protein
MRWAQRLKRVFGTDLERCEQCGGAVKVIASIEDPEVIAVILQHQVLDRRADSHPRPPAARAPPLAGLDPFESADPA